MHFFKGLGKKWTSVEEHIVAFLLIAIMMITFWAVITRFIFNDASTWAEEAARYLTIWSVFIGASLGVKKGAHIGVEAFVMILPKKLRQYIDILINLVCIGFCFAIAYIGYDYLLKLNATGQLSPAMRIPIITAYAAVPLGCFFMALSYIMLVIEQVFNLKSREEIYAESTSITGGE
ncbi:MAG: TRAP transporter small permease [Bacillota bacterium]